MTQILAALIAGLRTDASKDIGREPGLSASTGEQGADINSFETALTPLVTADVVPDGGELAAGAYSDWPRQEFGQEIAGPVLEMLTLTGFPGEESQLSVLQLTPQANAEKGTPMPQGGINLPFSGQFETPLMVDAENSWLVNEPVDTPDRGTQSAVSQADKADPGSVVPLAQPGAAHGQTGTTGDAVAAPGQVISKVPELTRPTEFESVGAASNTDSQETISGSAEQQQNLHWRRSVGFAHRLASSLLDESTAGRPAWQDSEPMPLHNNLAGSATESTPANRIAPSIQESELASRLQALRQEITHTGTLNSSPANPVQASEASGVQAGLQVAHSEVPGKMSADSFRLAPALDSPRFAEDLGKQLTVLVNRNTESARIEIDPPELGPLQVRIQMNQDQVSIQISANNALVKEAVDQTLSRIQQLFEEQGMNLVDVDVADSGQHQRHASAMEKDTEDSHGVPGQIPEEATEIRHINVDDGKIDYFI